MSNALWRIPLGGYCDVCAQRAAKLVVYPHGRAILHEYGGSCWVANPGAPVHGPKGYAAPFPRRTSA